MRFHLTNMLSPIFAPQFEIYCSLDLSWRASHDKFKYQNEFKFSHYTKSIEAIIGLLCVDAGLWLLCTYILNFFVNILWHRTLLCWWSMLLSSNKGGEKHAFVMRNPELLKHSSIHNRSHEDYKSTSTWNHGCIHVFLQKDELVFIFSELEKKTWAYCLESNFMHTVLWQSSDVDLI